MTPVKFGSSFSTFISPSINPERERLLYQYKEASLILFKTESEREKINSIDLYKLELILRFPHATRFLFALSDTGREDDLDISKIIHTPIRELEPLLPFIQQKILSTIILS